MKITTFNPQIITNNADELVELFEMLGFEKTHTKKAIGEHDALAIVMKNDTGFKIDISQPDFKLPQDVTSIRINVDNFDEAYEMFISRGFENFYGDHAVMTPSSKSAVLRSPSGFAVNLVEHIKK